MKGVYSEAFRWTRQLAKSKEGNKGRYHWEHGKEAEPLAQGRSDVYDASARVCTLVYE